MKRFPQRGSMVLVICVAVVILTPILMMLVSWFRTQQKLLTLSQIKIGRVDSGLSAASIAAKMVQQSFNPMGMTTRWTPGLTESYDLWVDSNTQVSVTVTHEGYN